jgi:LysM repeat protein
MYRLVYYLRILLTIGIVAGVIAGVGYFISTNTYQEARDLYYRQATVAVETAIAGALFTATRTAEAPLPQFRLVQPAAGESLTALADRYDTTLEAIQMANGLAADVTSSGDQPVVVPAGEHALIPPRRLTPYTASAGDTLAALAETHKIPLDLLEADNPVLARRGLIPGDVVFIAVLL